MPECDIIELRSTLMWDWFKRLREVYFARLRQQCERQDKVLACASVMFPWLVCRGFYNKWELVGVSWHKTIQTDILCRQVLMCLAERWLVVWLVLGAINFATCTHSLQKLLSKLPALCVSFLLSGGWSSSKCKMWLPNVWQIFSITNFEKVMIDLHVNVAHWQQPCSLCRLCTNSF